MRAQPWAAAFEGKTYYWRPTSAEAVDHAQNVGFILAHPPTYKGYVPSMKTANAQLVLATYTNLVLIDMTESGASALPDSAFTKNADGDYMTGSDATYARLLNPLDAAATSYKIKSAVNRMNSSGYPDLYCDVASATAPFGPYMVGPPINPQTAQVWTVNDWAAATAELQKAIRAGVEKALGRPVRLVINSLSNGPAYWSSNMQTLRPGVYAACCEGWLRSGATSPPDRFPSEKVWKQCVDLVIDAEAKGFKVLAMTKLWSVPAATAAQQQQWGDYASSSFLMASNGSSHLELSYYKGDALTVKVMQKVELGDPTGAYTKEASGVYTRTFVRGKVFVNPTASPLTQAGVTIPPYTGKVLL